MKTLCEFSYKMFHFNMYVFFFLSIYVTAKHEQFLSNRLNTSHVQKKESPCECINYSNKIFFIQI